MLIATSAYGTAACCPADSAQASAEYPIRINRYGASIVMPNAVLCRLAGSSAIR